MSNLLQVQETVIADIAYLNKLLGLMKPAEIRQPVPQAEEVFKVKPNKKLVSMAGNKRGGDKGPSAADEQRFAKAIGDTYKAIMSSFDNIHPFASLQKAAMFTFIAA